MEVLSREGTCNANEEPQLGPLPNEEARPVTRTGLQRVVIGVDDLDKAIALYSKLLGSRFHIVPEELTLKHDVRVAMSFDAGIELVQGLPGTEKADRGLGLLGVV